MQVSKDTPPPSNINQYVIFSFTITFIFLLTTGTITLIEALRTPNAQVRHILNLETCISIIASYFYSVFMSEVDESVKTNTPIDWGVTSQTRYIDWSITTPLMLLTLCLVLGGNIGKPLYFSIFLLIMFMNYSMLGIGYLGEVYQWDKLSTSLLGFVPFFAMFTLIFTLYVLPKYRLDNYVLFGIYVLVWSMYGIVYLLNEDYKNICLNILDLIAKCFVGLGLWAYYTKIFV